MSSRRIMSSQGVPPYVKPILGWIMSHWHGPCPRHASEIMSSSVRKKKRPRALDTGTLM
jgi:hypothetical protein